MDELMQSVSSYKLGLEMICVTFSVYIGNSIKSTMNNTMSHDCIIWDDWLTNVFGTQH